MGHARSLFRLISLTSFVLTVTSACRPGGIGGLALRPGEWAGAGDQGFKIEFAVAQNSKALTFYSLFYPLPCVKPGGFESVVSEGNVPLNGSQFELSGAHIRVTARFVAPERAEGTWTVKAHQSPQFGDCRAANGTWVAWAQDAGTLTPAPTATPSPAPPTLTPLPPTATVLSINLTPTLTPAALAATAPVIESVNLRYSTSSSGLVVFQDVKFRDSDGDAYVAHYELVRSPETGLQVADGAIDAPSQRQKLGATITGQWDCGGSKYDVTLAVTILDRAGNRSNTVEYTMNCR